jgi:hypothetical protein
MGLTDGTYTAIVTVSGGNGINVSFNISFTVNAATPVITITTQPSRDAGVTHGQITAADTLSVTASVNPAATLTYQWYSSGNTDTNTGGTLIAGATSSVFQIPTDITATAPSQYFYYCVVSSAGAVDVTSQAGRVIVYPHITITTQPAANTTVTAGSITQSLSVVAASNPVGMTILYQWYSNSTNANTGGTPISGATSATFNIPTTLTAGTYFYYCIARPSVGADAVSDVATVTVNAAAEYNTGDIAVINAIIANNGLTWTPAPADGSSVPADWVGLDWTGNGGDTDRRIEYINLSYGGIALTGTLNVSGLSELWGLDVNGSIVANNQLTGLNLSNLPKLRRLYFRNNQVFGTLNVNHLTALEELDGVNNNLTGVLDLSNLPALKWFNGVNNQLTGVILNSNVSYDWFDVSENNMTTHDVDMSFWLPAWGDGTNPQFLFYPQNPSGFSVTYDLNGGTGTTPTQPNVAGGGTFNTAASAGLTAPATYTQFKQWNTQADGLGTDFPVDTAVTMPPNNLTLYAIWDGDGTAGAPFRVRTPGDLSGVGLDTGAHMGWTLAAHYQLMNDVTAPAGFVPIGLNTMGLSGSFDGGGNTIILTIDMPSQDQVALFRVSIRAA